MRSFRILAASLMLSAATGGALATSLTYVVNNEPEHYDPSTSSETFASALINNAFEGLVQIDRTGKLVPALAESWTVSADGLTYTFKLRPNLKWSDGKPLTAADFVFAWRRVLTPSAGAKNAAHLFTIKGGKDFYDGKAQDLALNATDERTLTFTLAQPVPHMLQLMTYSTFYPVRKDIVEKDEKGWTRKAETYVGTGPFRVTAFNLGKGVELEKNPNYHGADKVKLEKLTFRLIPDLSTALAAFEAGNVTGTEDVPPAEIPRLSASSDAFIVVPTLGTTYAFFNPHVKPLDNQKVRKALSLAISRKQIIENVLQSADRPALGLVPNGMSLGGKDFREGTKDYGLAPDARVEEARKLLAEAGYPNGQGFPATTFVTYSSPAIQKIVEAVQQMWKKNLNIDVKIQATEWKVYYPEVRKTEYQIAQMGWGADYPHPMTFLENFVTGSPNNLAKWSSADFDAAITAAKAAKDEGAAADALRKAEGIFMEDHIVLPMFYRSKYMMMSPKAKGFWRSAMNVPYFKEVDMQK